LWPSFQNWGIGADARLGVGVSLKFRTDMFGLAGVVILTRELAPGSLRESEKSGVQGGAGKKQQNREDESAEDGNDLEQIIAALGVARAGKSSSNCEQARAGQKTRVGSHHHLRYFGAHERCLSPRRNEGPALRKYFSYR
jgi:hypothetical protein